MQSSRNNYGNNLHLLQYFDAVYVNRMKGFYVRTEEKYPEITFWWPLCTHKNNIQGLLVSSAGLLPRKGGIAKEDDVLVPSPPPNVTCWFEGCGQRTSGKSEKEKVQDGKGCQQGKGWDWVAEGPADGGEPGN